MGQQPPLCQSGQVTNGTPPASSDVEAQSGLAYITTLPTVGKAETAVCLTLAAAGACLYATRMGAMVRDRLSHSHLTLASNLTALFPVYQWLICLAILVPKSAEFMHVLMAAYSMVAFNELANLLAFKFGAIRFILGPRRALADQTGCEDGARVAVLRTKPLWSRFQLLTARALVRQGQLFHCCNLAVSAAILLDNGGARPPQQLRSDPQPPWQPPLEGWLVWLRGLAAASRLAGSLAAVALVARCCRRPPLLPGYRLGAKFVPLAGACLAQMGLHSAAYVADFWKADGANAAEIAVHSQFALQLVLSALQSWSLVEFQLSRPQPTPALLTAQPQPVAKPLPRSRSPTLTAELGVDDSVPADPAAAAAASIQCRACRGRLASDSVADSCSRDITSATTQVFGY
ncbi:hypothetical protein BOX15_Mlig033371g1 [Macrostomum lignano]|uniref:Uncharacterized protein n=1 Tax=Macrostomum lignano TaxID=282301 RepID=A0A267E7M2_9PLAT|nr:hypothetical protein BOX15_Mlig033371g1 [Macrostomum lignano]